MNMNKVIDNEFEDLYFLVVSILDNHPIIIVIEQGWVNLSFFLCSMNSCRFFLLIR